MGKNVQDGKELSLQESGCLCFLEEERDLNVK